MTTPTCVIEDCDRLAHCKSMCKRHYERFRLHGAPTYPACLRCGVEVGKVTARHCGPCSQAVWLDRLREGACIIEGCDKRRQRSWGLCSMHAARKKRHGDPMKPPQRTRGVRTTASVRAGARKLRTGERERWAAKLEYWGHACWMCGSPWEHVDHVKPLRAGGAHIIANLRPACQTCNHSKSDRWPFDTRRRPSVDIEVARLAVAQVNVGEFDERRFAIALRRAA